MTKYTKGWFTQGVWRAVAGQSQADGGYTWHIEAPDPDRPGDWMTIAENLSGADAILIEELHRKYRRDERTK